VTHSRTVPLRAGASFKAGYFAEILETKPDVGFFEVHAENYMGAGGPPHAQLERLRRDYPISVHGVGLSIGGADGLDTEHLDRLKRVVDRYQPALFSEHLAWSTHQGAYLNDLLAVPYTHETLKLVTEHIDEVQTHVGRMVLLENPSTYIAFAENDFDEVTFISEIQRRTGCGLLLDVNNVYVSSMNHAQDAQEYIERFPMDHVGEIHVAGHATTQDADGHPLLIDAHNGVASAPVMALLSQALSHKPDVPVLIEWDNDLPDWSGLYREVEKVSSTLRAAASGSEMTDVA